jgi:hypothetical protein
MITNQQCTCSNRAFTGGVFSGFPQAITDWFQSVTVVFPGSSKPAFTAETMTRAFASWTLFARFQAPQIKNIGVKGLFFA